MWIRLERVGRAGGSEESAEERNSGLARCPLKVLRRCPGGAASRASAAHGSGCPQRLHAGTKFNAQHIGIVIQSVQLLVGMTAGAGSQNRVGREPGREFLGVHHAQVHAHQRHLAQKAAGAYRAAVLRCARCRTSCRPSQSRGSSWISQAASGRGSRLSAR